MISIHSPSNKSVFWATGRVYGFVEGRSISRTLETYEASQLLINYPTGLGFRV